MPPSSCVISIVLRQSPDTMQVIWQNHRGDDFEWPLGTRHAKCTEKIRNVVHKQRPFALLKIHGKEIGSTGNPDATVIGHGRSMAVSSPERSRQVTSECVGKIR